MLTFNIKCSTPYSSIPNSSKVQSISTYPKLLIARTDISFIQKIGDDITLADKKSESDGESIMQFGGFWEDFLLVLD